MTSWLEHTVHLMPLSGLGNKGIPGLAHEAFAFHLMVSCLQPVTQHGEGIRFFAEPVRWVSHNCVNAVVWHPPQHGKIVFVK